MYKQFFKQKDDYCKGHEDILLMGQVSKEQRNLGTRVYIKTPFFAKPMKNDRFRQIWRAGCFNNNENIKDGLDRLCKVRPVLDYFLPKCLHVYKSTQKLYLDGGEFRVYNVETL